MNLEECFSFLDRFFDSETQNKIRSGPESIMNSIHCNIGKSMRNSLGLWPGTELYNYFNELGLDSSSDMSELILVLYWRVKNNKPLNIQDEVKKYQDWLANTQETDGI